MNELIDQLYVLAAVVGAFALGPLLALIVLLIRRRLRRARRRSPINKDLLRGPGFSLAEQLEDLGGNLSAALLMLAVWPVMVLAIFLAQAQLSNAVWNIWPIYALGAAGIVLVALWKLVTLTARLEKLRVGYDAELAVGQELDQLMTRGARVFHDFPAENFNIDHVLICEGGVFAIETKGFTKLTRITGRAGSTVCADGKTLRFPTWVTSEPLDQAERQAKWLSQWLGSAMGEPVPVEGVVALPGWWVERTGRGRVRVVNGREVYSLVDSAPILTRQFVRRVAHQVEQRCRTVPPRYGRPDRSGAK